MKILLLGPYREELVQFLLSFGDEVQHIQEPISGRSKVLDNTDYLISYGYRYIIKKDVLNRFWGRAVNLHISLLPWNRGADPNLWSFLEDTPKGVTIHYIDYGIDTGDVLAQERVSFNPEETLRSSYEKLNKTIESLFKRKWPYIREGMITAIPQSNEGTFHSLKDKEKFNHLLTMGWDTPVRNLIGRALRNKE